MSYEAIAIIMFGSMLLMLLTGQRVFAAIGIVSTVAALLLWGEGGVEMPFTAAFKLFKWYPLLTLPMFIFMGYILSESKLADDLYRMFHVWMGPINGGLAIGTIGLMVLVSAMNGLSVAGMAIGATMRVASTTTIRNCRPGKANLLKPYAATTPSSAQHTVVPPVMIRLLRMFARIWNWLSARSKALNVI